MARKIDEYEFRVTKQIRDNILKYEQAFLELDKYLKNNFFLNIRLVNEIPSNKEGPSERVYRAKPSNRELTDQEVERLKDIADDLYLSLRMFGLEEII